jgi:hypothetical protein
MTSPTLTDKMLAFLQVRDEHGSDASAARAVAVAPITVTGWRRNSKKHREGVGEFPRENYFMELYDQKIAAVTQGVENFDEDAFLRKTLAPKALIRYDEILSTKITSDMTASEKQVVRQAALDVLKGTGVLNPDVQLTNIAVMVEKFAEEGVTYEAAWSKKD